MLEKKNLCLTPNWKIRLLLAVCLVAGCASTEHRTDTTSLIDDNRLVYARAGSAAPTVVLQAGLADTKNVWSDVFAGIARNHSVIAFDRPGRNANPQTQAPRDPCTIAAEQRALLQSAGIAPPYILVGHSLGGLYQYVFARLYPAEVAGLVLVDPTAPNHWELMQRDAPQAAIVIKTLRTVAFNATDKREFDSQTSCLDKLDAGRLPQPTRILVAGRFTRAGEAGAFEAMVKQSRQQWLTLTPAPKLEVIWDSGHYIQQENPEDVIAAVQQVIAEVRVK